ncbi:MAG: HAD family phosphatase [Selenomonadaceae bacterium]|nr:HAD family phosphatase [Selenomonadaceae bacterium]
MAVKLFVSDIDGTILVSGKKISARNISAIKKMADAGIIVTIATGRMYRAALPIAQELGVDVPIITYNGALIKSTDGKIIHAQSIPAALVIELTNFFEARGWYLQNYSGDNLFYPVRNEYTELYETAQKISGVETGWDGLREKTADVYKLLSISANAEETAARMAAVKAEFGARIDVTKSHPQFTEISCPGVSKASAIKILAQKFGVDRAEVMAIGDSDNDLPMLKAAGISVAMGNGTDEVKRACTYVTANCEDDGFAAAVEKYVLQ